MGEQSTASVAEQQQQRRQPAESGGLDPIHSLLRSAEFWGRASVIYGSYKATQLRALLLRLQGKSRQEIKEAVWDEQHKWAGKEMYRLCIDLRGFYLKAGQFLGARADFVPEQICRYLCLLQDKVPPMPPERTEHVIKQELGVNDLGELFDWIDLEQPLGSASISQVHKARLRRFTPHQLNQFRHRRCSRMRLMTLGPGDTAWSVCNDAGISLPELADANKGLDIADLGPGDVVRVPEVLGLSRFRDGQLEGRLLVSEAMGQGEEEPSASGSGWSSCSSSSSSSGAACKCSDLEESSGYAISGGSGGGGFMGLGHLMGLLSRAARGGGGGQPSGSAQPPARRPVTSAAAAGVAHAVAIGSVPRSGLVAVKVQYPDALQVMTEDLINLRAISAFLSRTELKFDLVSAVDELQKQIHLEFNFMREARVMDSIASHLSPIQSRVAVPISVPGLVTRRVMAMTYMEGLPLMQLQDKVKHLPKWKRDKAARIVLSNLSEAYGRMILGSGLFQADGHPGNVLVRAGGSIALLDYGQSKQLPGPEKEGLARLVVAMHGGDTSEVDAALSGLGVVTTSHDPAVRRQMAYEMFDTRGSVDPFDESSPIKKAAIKTFPPDLFFVLRVTQLLRGIAQGMGIFDFSCASQWAPLARETIRAAERRRQQQQLCTQGKQQQEQQQQSAGITATSSNQQKRHQSWQLPSLAQLATPLCINC